MKRYIKSILAVALLGSAMCMPLTASAQKGEKTLGVAGGVATHNDSGYAKLYFQYTFANHFRIAPEIGYVFSNNDNSAFIASIDMHFPFKIVKAFNIYPLVGVTANNWTDEGFRVGADFGAGFELYLTKNLKLNLQGKYSLMNDTGGGFFDLGIGYIF